jgi:hypothetical protein
MTNQGYRQSRQPWFCSLSKFRRNRRLNQNLHDGTLTQSLLVFTDGVILERGAGRQAKLPSRFIVIFV